MNRLGRKIYYDLETGVVVLEIGERIGSVTPTTIEQDIKNYIVLSERNRDTFALIELPFGAYSRDFLECSGYRINPATKELEFSYPDPNLPEAPQEFRPPLSEEVERLKQEDLNNKEAIAELYLMSVGGM